MGLCRVFCISMSLDIDYRQTLLVLSRPADGDAGYWVNITGNFTVIWFGNKPSTDVAWLCTLQSLLCDLQRISTNFGCMLLPVKIVEYCTMVLVLFSEVLVVPICKYYGRFSFHPNLKIWKVSCEVYICHWDWIKITLVHQHSVCISGKWDVCYVLCWTKHSS